MRFFLSIILIFVIPTILIGDLHYWTDENGVRHVSNDPPPANLQKYETMESSPKKEIPKPQKTVSDTTLPEIEHSDAQVIIYTKRHSHPSMYAKAWLNDNKVDYVEYDLETSEAYKQAFEKSGGGKLPLVIIGKEKMNGFNEKKVKRLLGME